MIFIDSGAWIALFDKDDQYHLRAKRLWTQIAVDHPFQVTSNLVLNETLTYLARRIRYPYAVEVGRKPLRHPTLEVFRSRDLDEENALDRMDKWSDQRLGFTDCVSLELMRRHGLYRVFSFDRHFALAGCEVIGLDA